MRTADRNCIRSDVRTEHTVNIISYAVPTEKSKEAVSLIRSEMWQWKRFFCKVYNKQNGIAGNAIPTMPILLGIKNPLDYPTFSAALFKYEEMIMKILLVSLVSIQQRHDLIPFFVEHTAACVIFLQVISFAEKLKELGIDGFLKGRIPYVDV